jgi:hypothetical protein
LVVVFWGGDNKNGERFCEVWCFARYFYLGVGVLVPTDVMGGL